MVKTKHMNDSEDKMWIPCITQVRISWMAVQLLVFQEGNIRGINFMLLLYFFKILCFFIIIIIFISGTGRRKT